MTIQMKATEQYFPVVLFIMLYKVVLTFESVDEIMARHTSQNSNIFKNAMPVLYLYSMFFSISFLLYFFIFLVYFLYSWYIFYIPDIFFIFLPYFLYSCYIFHISSIFFIFLLYFLYSFYIFHIRSN